MHWFGGSMAEAVTLSKQKNAIFVVFVEGDDDLSKQLSSTIDNGVVLKRLGDQTNFLAVKLKSGSENYTFFAQIYQFVPIPSLFFIGRNGTPLEVVCAGVEADNLATRIDRILQEHRKEQPSLEPTPSSSNIKDQTTDFLQTEANAAQAQNKSSEEIKSPEPIVATPSVSGIQKSDDVPKSSDLKKVSPKEPEPSEPAAKIAKTEHVEQERESQEKSQEYEVVCEGDVCVRRPKSQAGPSTAADNVQPQATENITESDESALSAEQKMEKAKELIEIRRREKADKEKEQAKQKEIERRSVGQGVAELKRWQAEQELKQIQEERRREKMENNLARQRILEQIAQDRAESRAREMPAPAQVPQQTTPAVGDAARQARVQFKLPDGRARTAHFRADHTLASLRDHVAADMQVSPSSFTLWTAFPRRELTESDATLEQLQLSPSAALLVLPRRTTVSARPSPFASVIAFLSQIFASLVIQPSHQIYTWLYSRLFNPTANPPPNPPSPDATPATPNQNPSLRRRGNVHRLTGDSSADDDNNTWNGNSTQQM